MPIKFKSIRESVNFRLDPKLLKAARRKAEKDNTSLTALVVRGLNIVIGNTSRENCIDLSVEIQEQLNELTARVEGIEAVIHSADSRRKRN